MNLAFLGKGRKSRLFTCAGLRAIRFRAAVADSPCLWTRIVIKSLLRQGPVASISCSITSFTGDHSLPRRYACHTALFIINTHITVKKVEINNCAEISMAYCDGLHPKSRGARSRTGIFSSKRRYGSLQRSHILRHSPDARSGSLSCTHRRPRRGTINLAPPVKHLALAHADEEPSSVPRVPFISYLSAASVRRPPAPI